MRAVLTLPVTHAQTLVGDLISPPALEAEGPGGLRVVLLCFREGPRGKEHRLWSTDGLGFEAYLCHLLVMCFGVYHLSSTYYSAWHIVGTQLTHLKLLILCLLCARHG